MSVTIPKKPRPMGEKEMPLVAPTPAPHIDADPMDSGRHVVADPLEVAPARHVDADPMPAGRHIEADPFGVSQYDEVQNRKRLAADPHQDGPVEAGDLQADDFAALGGLAKAGVEFAANGARRAIPTIAEQLKDIPGVSKRLVGYGDDLASYASKLMKPSAPAVEELRALKDAAQAGKISPEELAQHARKLMGKGEIDVARRPEWEKAANVANKPYREPVIAANREANAGFGSYAAKPAPGLATNARGSVPREHPVVNQFTAEANQWLNDFAASLKTGPIGPK